MKWNQLVGWLAFVSISAMGACGGVSAIGSGDDPGPGKAGSSGSGGAMGEGATGAGAAANGATSMGASANTAGKDPGMGGSGAAPNVEMCASDMDCPNYGAPCEPCADGSYACNKTYCAKDGTCVHTRDTCTVECQSDMDCGVSKVACLDCGDGKPSCPSTQCTKGICQTTLPSCAGDEQCKGQPCGSACKACAPGDICDGSAVGYCSSNGQCQAGVPKCGDPGACKTSDDCGTPPPECVACGNDTCAKFECLEQKCVFACPPNPEPECMTEKDCGPVDDVCIACEKANSCAVQACVNGSCQMVCPVK